MHLRASVVLVVLAAIVFGAPSPARAAGYISPFAGINFGGDSGCLAVTSCTDRTSTLGVAIGTSNVIFGFEEEFGYAKNFFGKDALQSTSVLTLMSNLMIGPRLGFVRPYGLIGAGIMKTRVELTLTDLTSGDTSFGWNIGGGLELSGAHFGVRGDVRYLHGVQDFTLPGLPVTDLKLDFGRASAGLVLRF
jgi:opacity protein-like surface antigen